MMERISVKIDYDYWLGRMDGARLAGLDVLTVTFAEYQRLLDARHDTYPTLDGDALTVYGMAVRLPDAGDGPTPEDAR